MTQKTAIKKWLKTNEGYFQSNPEILKSLMNDPTFLARFNQMISKRKGRLERRLVRMERRGRLDTNTVLTSKPKTKRGLLRFKLPSMSSMTEKLNQVNGMIASIRELTGK